MSFIKQGKVSLTSILIVAVAGVIVGGGILAYQYWWLPKQETPPANTDETANWQTYRNEEYGFEVKYPAEWYISEFISGFKFSPYPNKNSDPNKGVPIGPKNTEVSVSIIAKAQNAEFGGLTQQFSPLTFSDSNTETVTLSGLPALKKTTIEKCHQYGSEKDIAIYQKDKDMEVTFRIANYNTPCDYGTVLNEEKIYSSIFNQILSGFKFIEPAIDISSWKTYRNEEYGFEVKYPAGMEITIPETAGLVEIHSNELGGFNVSYTAHYDQSQNRYWTKEDMANQRADVEKEQVILDGLAAIKITYNLGLQKIINIFVQKNGDTKIYEIDIEPNKSAEESSLTTLNQILSTFRFIPSNQAANITVLSPNGGEKLEIGKTYQIRYQINNPPTANVQNWKVSSFANCLDWNVGGSTVIDSHYLSADKGFVSWTIPAKPNGPANQCKVKIEMVDTVNAGTPQAAVYRDESDATFSIIQ